MQLSLELMTCGSEQVDMSDEGSMTDDIEDCLQVVFQALEHYDLPADALLTWCWTMRTNDCVGFIAADELQRLQIRIEAVTAR